jgi:hypothetical protein
LAVLEFCPAAGVAVPEFVAGLSAGGEQARPTKIRSDKAQIKVNEFFI